MLVIVLRSLKYIYLVLIWKKIFEFGGLYVKICKVLLLVY